MIKCTNRWCVLKNTCYRATKRMELGQEWCDYRPNVEDNCDYFIDDSREDRDDFE